MGVWLTSSLADLSPHLFLAIAGATAVLLVALTLLGRRLQIPGAPKGILSLELEGSLEDAVAVVAQWKRLGVLSNARWSIALDFLFIAAYATCLGVTCARGTEALAISRPLLSG